MRPSEEVQSASVRMPATLKRRLRIKAAINDHSLSDEIAARLERSIQIEEAEKSAQK